MRPLRLELKGFTSFRDQTEIDFSDADYFVLIGPTGSGKSTVIDAICFALYGSVPRYDNRSLVAPVITQGQLEARVRFDFLIDEVEYTAVRVVRRQGTGASTREARLQRGEEVVAGNERELTEAVTDLLGLSFEHFTRCVVLPQGDFAQFLHDKPAVRQDMLVNLLGLRVYEEMREAAQDRARSAADQLLLTNERLERDFVDADAGTLAEAKAKVKAVAAARKAVEDAAPKLAGLDMEIAEAEGASARIATWLERLSRLEAPRDLEEAADAMTHAEKAAAEAQEATTAAEQATAAAAAAYDALPDRDALADAVSAHARRAELLTQVKDIEANLEKARIAESESEASLQDAREALADKQAAEQAARDAHSAQHLAADLTKGEPCPVCFQTVATLPKHKKPAAITSTEKAVASAEKAVEKASKTHKLDGDRARDLQTKAATLAAQAESLASGSKAWPDQSEAAAKLKEVEVAAKTLDAAREAEKQARAAATEAQNALAALRSENEKARNEFESLRDSLAELKPPPAARRNLADDWGALLAWRTDRVAELEKEAKTRAEAVEGLERERSGLFSSTLEICRGCDIEAEADDLSSAVVEAATKAEARVAQIEAAIKESKDLARRAKELEARRDLASALATHLKANGFERWLLNEALHKLVAGATEILRDMSDGRYSLKVDEKGHFFVVDHHDADETRPARTLSGGETFQASLALALALSDQLIELAARGSAKLEAIFLDEGFGTLDPQALGTVAGTVENLSAKGRVVGVITHVQELANEIPIKFQVRKEARTSTIERIEE